MLCLLSLACAIVSHATAQGLSASSQKLSLPGEHKGRQQLFSLFNRHYEGLVLIISGKKGHRFPQATWAYINSEIREDEVGPGDPSQKQILLLWVIKVRLSKKHSTT